MVGRGQVLGGQWAQTKTDITPTVSGTQLTSEELVYGYNNVTSSANDTDGVVLPPALRRAVVWVANDDAAQDVVVFGNGSDTVHGTAGATGVAQGQQTLGLYVCFADGAWIKLVELTLAT